MTVKPLTYRRLLKIIAALPEESLDMDVTMLDGMSETHPVYGALLFSNLPISTRGDLKYSLKDEQLLLVKGDHL